jgi:predicted HD phosphohydrolase
LHEQTSAGQFNKLNLVPGLVLVVPSFRQHRACANRYTCAVSLSYHDGTYPTTKW